jgi:ribosomal protein S21
MEFIEFKTQSFYGKDSTRRRKKQACVRAAFFLQSIVRRKRKEARGQQVRQ